MIEEIKSQLITDIDRRLEDKIIEQKNAEILKRLIENAETIDDAQAIATLGTTWKRTGFHFDPRLEKGKGDTIKYFKKNDKLSFSDGNGGIVHKLIIGDNYDALLNLLIEYRGKIDVIYIDPPYGKDSMGEFAKTNYDNAITRDNLLSMLYSRLLIAKQLLSNDGVIFCSIDDRNQAYVKCLFDEVFEENNFICNFIWEKTQHFGRQKINYYSNADYVLCYAKHKIDGKIKELLIERVKTELEDAPLYNASNPIKKLLFPKGSVKFNLKDGVYNSTTDKKYVLHNPVEVKNGYNNNDFELSFSSRWARQTVLEEIDNGTVYWVKTENFAIRAIYNDGRESKESPKQIIFTNTNNEFVTKDKYGTKVGTNEDGSSLLNDIFSVDAFDYPKSSSLIGYLISLVNKEDAIVLDFFAGSGTTGQAVMELNKKDGGKRQYICVQMPEDLDNALLKNPKSKTIKNQIEICDKNGRPHCLSEITTERLRRIMTGCCYNGSSDFEWTKKNNAYGGALDVYEIAKVANFESTIGKTPFDVIDETLYGKEKFKTLKEKIEWVCSNFEGTQILIESDEEWLKRMEDR